MTAAASEDKAGTAQSNTNTEEPDFPAWVMSKRKLSRFSKENLLTTYDQLRGETEAGRLSA